MNKAFEIALGEFGQHGVVGEIDNPKILNYFKVAGFSGIKDDETSWCAGFVNYCFEVIGVTGTRSLAARSFLSFGVTAAKPILGDVVVLWRMRPDSWFGHVGFFVRETATTVFILGGNQDNSVSIKEFPKSRVLGYRRMTTEKPV